MPADQVPKGAYHSSEFRLQVERYASALPIDMLIIGSSVASVNYPPVPLDDRLHELGYAEFTSYNAGIRGCNYECITIGIRRHYLLQISTTYRLGGAECNRHQRGQQIR